MSPNNSDLLMVLFKRQGSYMEGSVDRFCVRRRSRPFRDHRANVCEFIYSLSPKMPRLPVMRNA